MRLRAAVGLIAVALVGCTLDDGPPDYAIPMVVTVPEVAMLFGIDETWAGGGGSQARTTTELVAFDPDRWAHAELLYSDYRLSEWINPSGGITPRGRVRELTVDGTTHTLTMVERPPAAVDEVLAGCIRLVLGTWDLEPASDEAVASFVERIEIELDTWRREAPEDPCEDRPLAPPAE